MLRGGLDMNTVINKKVCSYLPFSPYGQLMVKVWHEGRMKITTVLIC